MKPRFEEHDNQLFRMLEKPEPLKEKNTNVLVQFITHGVIGEYVMEHWLDCGQENVPIFVDSVDSDGDVTVFIENGNEHYGCPFPMFEIIGTFVEEGSADWALYQMMQGKMVCHKTSPWDWYRMDNDHAIQNRTAGHMPRVSAWLESTVQSGWQIYKEPEQPKTMPVNEFTSLSDAPIGWICKTRDGGNFPLKYIEVSPTRYAYEDKSGLTVYVMANGHYKKNGTDGRDIISCEHEQPKPEPEYKAGDWVEVRNCRNGNTYQWKIDHIDSEIHIGQYIFDFSGESKMDTLRHLSIVRKLKASEVVIQIGCLRGTVRPVSTNGIHMWFHLIGVDDKLIAIIRIGCLDAPTRKLVESLLKAQDEEK